MVDCKYERQNETIPNIRLQKNMGSNAAYDSTLNNREKDVGSALT